MSRMHVIKESSVGRDGGRGTGCWCLLSCFRGNGGPRSGTGTCVGQEKEDVSQGEGRKGSTLCPILRMEICKEALVQA